MTDPITRADLRCPMTDSYDGTGLPPCAPLTCNACILKRDQRIETEYWAAGLHYHFAPALHDAARLAEARLAPLKPEGSA